jgi:anti-sigma B factor antagonist
MTTDPYPHPEPALAHVLRPGYPPPLAPTTGAAAGGSDAPAGTALSALNVACEEHEDLVLIALGGELDIYTVPDFLERVRRYDPAEVQLVIDLAQVSLLDSAGIGGLVSLRNEAHRAGAQLGLVCPEHQLARLFWATGLRPAFAFGDDLTAVRAALAARRLARPQPTRAVKR